MGGTAWAPGSTISVNSANTIIPESQVATAQGQTLITLLLFTYTPNTNSLLVWVNGVFQVSGIDYVETANNKITFTSGLTIGDRVTIIGLTAIIGTTPVSAVPVTPYMTTVLAAITAQSARTLLLTTRVIDLIAAGAVGDGITDDTVAVQAAINAAILSGFALRVIAPSISYRLTAPITINGPLTLYGDGCAPYLNNATPQLRGKGSWFYINHTGKGFVISPAVIQFSSVQLRDFGTYRDQPAIGPGWAPTAHDYDIYINDADVDIYKLTLLNPTKAIFVTQAGASRLTINGLRGQPFQVGINIDTTMDVASINDVRFWAYWANDANVHFYTRGNLIACQMARCDNPQVTNFFSIYANKGFSFTSNGSGVTSRAQLKNIDIDGVGSKVIAIEAGANGTSIEICGLIGFGGSGAPEGINCAANNCYIQATNVRMSVLWFTASSINGAGNEAQYTNWIVDGYNGANAAFPGFFAAAGNRMSITDRVKSVATFAAPLIGTPGTISYGAIVASGNIVLTAAASVVITHNTGWIPQPQQINFQMNSSGGANSYFIDTITATQFTFHCSGAVTANGTYAIDARIA